MKYLFALLAAASIAGCSSAQRTTPGAAASSAASLEVHEGMWPIRDTRLFVREVGPKDAPVLVVVHGGPGGNHISLLPLEALAGTYRVVFYDQRGTGESDRLDVSPARPESFKKLSVKENVQDLEALRVRLGRAKISLIGHSWGGALAVFYAAAYPEHVEKLIVYSGGPETLELAKRKKAAHRAKLNERERKLLKQRAGKLGAAAAQGRPQAELDRLFADLATVLFPSLDCKRPVSTNHYAGRDGIGRGGFWANQAAAQYVGSFEYASIADGLRRLKAPALLIWGKCEPSPRERLTNLLDYLSNARFVVFDKSGHNAMQEQRELFFETIRSFLAGKPLPPATRPAPSPLPDGSAAPPAAPVAPSTQSPG